MSAIIGIDFGTTNSLISVVLSNRVRSYTDNNLPHPSVVSYAGDQVICGREAKNCIENTVTVTAEYEGIIRSPKQLLGTGAHRVMGKDIEPSAMIAELMKHLKDHAVSQDSQISAFDRAVVSIPVSMDGRKRRELRDALMRAGINVIQFVHEPLAALYAHFRDQELAHSEYVDHIGDLALVFDWGGGTLDLTLCEIGRTSLTQIINLGDNQVGGDFVDEAILRFVLEKHTAKHAMIGSEDVNPGARAKLLEQCEKAKIWLSESDDTFIYVPDYYAYEGGGSDIQQEFSRKELLDIADSYVKRGLATIESLLSRLDIDQRRIAFCLATGGMINMPAIKSALLQMFGADRLHLSERGDRIISEGCAWIANDNARLALAKPLEVVEARQSYLPVLKAGDSLPIEGEIIVENLIMYCVDPRDGHAKFQLVRPQQAGKSAAADPRDIYTNLTVRVDPKSEPFLERIDLKFSIDDNLVVCVEARSSLLLDSDVEEIFDLEFSLSTSSIKANAGSSTTPPVGNENHRPVAVKRSPMPVGAVTSRSNVTSEKNRLDLVPGEYLYQVDRARFDTRHPQPLPHISHWEHLYYQPCSRCRKRYNDPDCHCSDELRH